VLLAGVGADALRGGTRGQRRPEPPTAPGVPDSPAGTSAARLHRLRPAGVESCTIKPGTNIFVAAATWAGQGLCFAHGWVVLLHPLTPGQHTIVIDDGVLPITTSITVKPWHEELVNYQPRRGG